jgi:hypothetical protein
MVKMKGNGKPPVRRYLQLELLERRNFLAISPIFTGRVVDQPVDGVPDLLGAGPSAFLNSSFDMRAVAEFDLDSLTSTPSLATLDFVLNVPAGGSGQRQLSLVIYAADGVHSLNDFDAPAIAVHPLYYWSSQLSRDYHVDLQNEIDFLLQQNATALGIRLEAVGEQSETRLIEPIINVDALPPPTGMRGYASIPSAIAANGQDDFKLEVDTHGDVSSVQLMLSGEWIVEQANGVVTLRDDGLEGDRIAGDFVFTTPSMRFPATREFSYGFYQRQVDSPAGIEIVEIGTLDITELDGTHTNFLINPQIGMLRSDIPLSPVTQIATDVQVSNYFVNIATDSSSLQTSLHGNQDLTQALLRRLHEAFPSAFDFANLVSTEHIEQRPRLSGRNFVAGQHNTIITDFTGTSRPLADNSANAGGDPRLKGVNYLDTFVRGLTGPTVTHELVHQWSAYLDASLGISDGGAHYRDNSSVGSLVGGQQWIANGDGSYTINDREGRNGATHASPLDLYFMGLADASEVPSILLFDPNANPPINLNNPHIPASSIIREVTIDQIIAQHGARTPDVSLSQKDFSIGFVGESSHRLLTQTEMTFYDILAAHYTRPIAPNMPTPNNEVGWVSIDRFFGHGSTWSSLVPGRTAASNEAPVAQNTEFFVSETVPPYYVNGGQSIVGRVPVVDAEGNPLAFAIRSGNEDADFIIDHVTGDIRVNDQLSAQRQSTYQFEVVIADLGAASKATTATITIHVTSTNSPPSIFIGSTPIAYSENAPAVSIASDGTVTDADSLDFNTGKLILQFTAGAENADRLEIRNEGTGTGQVGVSDAEITYEGAVIGSFTGGAGATALTITFGGNSNALNAQAVLRNITFRSASDTPSTAPKTLRASLTDGDGGISNLPTKTITVTPINDAPTIGDFDTAIFFTENASPLVIDSDATVIDSDSFDFDGGKLNFLMFAGAQATDKFEIRNEGTAAGKIGVSGPDVTFGGLVIGSFTGFSTTSLTVNFNSSATPYVVQSLLRNVTYHSVSDAPSTGPKTIRVSLTDGDGGTSNLPTKTVTIQSINDAPVVGAFDAPILYTENAAALLIDSNATVADIDSSDFSGGKLTFQLTIGGQSTDRIEIRNEGTAPGKIGVAGADVTFGGTVIGAFTGGVGQAALVITFNSGATPSIVQALLRDVTYRNVAEAPSAAPKTVRVSLTDGDGGSSNLPTKTITITPVNDAPVIAAFDTAVLYTENAAATILDPNATVVDVDSANLDAGKLTIQAIAGGHGGDRFEVRNQGTAAGQIGVSGADVTYGGTVIGSFTGGIGTTPLVITFNSSATPVIAQALLRNITYRSASEAPSTSPKTVRGSLTDGDGATSNLPTKTITITPVNDAPVLTDPQSSINYVLGAPPALLKPQATVSDPDSPNFQSGSLTVAIIANADATDQLSVRNQGTNNGQIGINGTDITYGGVTIATIGGNGTTSLTFQFNEFATPAAVQALFRNLTFANAVTTASKNTRSIRFTLSDGDGGSTEMLKDVVVL